jgi:hypothetical protein
MKQILILNLLLLYKILFSSSINFNSDFNFNFNYNAIRLRNSYLRVKLSNDFSKIKRSYNKLRLKTLNFCYDLSCNYYSLSQEERTLIENIISLSY